MLVKEGIGCNGLGKIGALLAAFNNTLGMNWEERNETNDTTFFVTTSSAPLL
jgi:hypothetical protein